MNAKAGRNDLCPCGSGKKYKSCCLNKERPKGSADTPRKKFTAKLISTLAKPVNLMERTYGKSFEAIEKGSPPPSSDLES